MRNSLTGGLVFAIAVASAAYGGEITWDGTNVQSGNWNDGTSWIGGQAPTSADTAQIKMANTVDVSATADGAFKIFKVQANGGDLTVNMGLGAHSLVGLNSTWGDSVLVNGTSDYSATLNLTSGTISNICSLVIGDVGPNGKVTLSGKGTKMLAYRDNTRIGSAYGFSTLEVLDGAYFRSGRETVLGYSDNDRQSNIVIRVSGAGSFYEDGNVKDTSGNHTLLPKYASGSKVIVENGACWTNVSGKSTYMASDSHSHDNDFIVRNGGYLHLKNAFHVGRAGPLNHFSVMDGSSASVLGELLVGVAATSYGNTALVTTNSWLRNSHHIGIGYGGSASNRMDVVGANAAVTNTAYDIGVGRAANYNTLRIADGGSVYGSRRFAVGAPLSFDSSSVVCGPVGNTALVEGKGSILHNKGNASGSSYVGWYGTNNTMTVRDGGRFRSDAALYVGYHDSTVSNRLAVTGENSFLQVNAATYLRSGSFNELRLEDGAQAYFKKIHVGAADGAHSNTVFIGSGCLVTNIFAIVVGTSDITAPENAVGNGVVISNATVWNSTEADEVQVNCYGKGGYLKVLDGAKLYVNQSVTVGGDKNTTKFTDCSDGLVEVDGEGSLLQSLQFHMAIGRWGHDNTIRVSNGGCYIVPNQMAIGDSAYEGSTNNLLHICNGAFTNASSQTLHLYNNSKVRWEGAKSTFNVSTIAAYQNAQLEFVFDKDGIAPFGPRFETYLIDADHRPTVEKITIDATEYVKNPAGAKRTFTILKSDDNRQCRVVGTGSNLPSADFEAINAAIAERIECVPSGFVKVTKVDMEHSRIEVKVKKQGLMILLR